MRRQEPGPATLRRGGFSPQLSPAAEEWLELYRRTHGHGDAIAAEIDRRLESCAGGTDGAKGPLIRLLRLRDLHRYVEGDPEMKALKRDLLESTVRWRQPSARWQAARELILLHLPAVLGAVPEELGAAFKRDLSVPGSRLGRLLRLCALMNLEAAGEMPPPNWVLRFQRGRFPAHVWELGRADAAERSAGEAWRPVSPLARWEYLGADLAERIFGLRELWGGPAWVGGLGRPGRGSTDAPSPAAGAPGPRTERTQVYCRFEPAETVLAQLPLLPVQREALLGDLLRYVHLRLGAEGVRQAALVFAASAGCAPGEPFALDLAGLARRCGLANAREERAAAQCLAAAVELLSAVTVQRVGPGEPETAGESRIRSTRLLTVLGWEGAARDGSGKGADERERLTVLPDRLLWTAAGRPLGEAFRDLPVAVLALPPREHPYALALAAWARQRFAERCGSAIECSASSLLHDAGIPVPEPAGQRMAETLKRDLQRLQELGVLGRWSLARDPGAPGPHVRLDPPGRRRPGLPGSGGWARERPGQAGRAQP